VALGKALDHWSYCRISISKTSATESEEDNQDDSWRRLLAIANVADPDPLRQRLRNLRETADRSEEVCEELDRLADDEELQRQPPETLFLLSLALHDHGLAEQAISVLRKAHERFPDDFWINLELANQLGQTEGDDVERLRFAAAAQALRPDSATAANNLGTALHELGETDQAVACYRSAIQLDPELPDLHHNLGNAFYELRKWPEAEAAYREAIRIKPDYPEAQYGLGAVFNQQKRYAEAESHFREAIRIKPDYAKAHNGLGAALHGAAGKSPLGHSVGENKLDEAVACYRKAIELDSNRTAPHRNLGLVYVRRNDLDNAVAFFRKAIELEPNFATAHCDLGEALYRQGKWDEAISACRKALELGPQETRHWWWLGWTQYQRGDWKASIESLEKSCRLQDEGKGDAGRWIVMALAHWKLVDEEELGQEERVRHQAEARRLYVQVDSQLSHWSGIHSWPYFHREMRDIWKFRAEARKLMPKQSLEEVVACQRKAIELDPDNEAARWYLGGKFFKLGLWSEAAEQYGQLAGCTRYEYFLSLLTAGDRSGYEELCRQAADRLAGSTNRNDLMQLARSCSLAPQGALPAESLAEIARKGLSKEPNSHWRKFFTGLCLYRAGEDAEAERLMSEALEQSPDWRAPHAGLSLVYHRLGDSEQARVHWEQAVAAGQDSLERLLNRPRESAHVPQPLGYAELIILVREASVLLEPDDGRETVVMDSQERLRRGKALMAIGEREQGLADLQAAVAESGNDPTICQWRDRILDWSDPDKQE
jgi:tetratricopeptide (TPR) repeat protein